MHGQAISPGLSVSNQTKNKHQKSGAIVFPSHKMKNTLFGVWWHSRRRQFPLPACMNIDLFCLTIRYEWYIKDFWLRRTRFLISNKDFQELFTPWFDYIFLWNIPGPHHIKMRQNYLNDIYLWKIPPKRGCLNRNTCIHCSYSIVFCLRGTNGI